MTARRRKPRSRPATKDEQPKKKRQWTLVVLGGILLVGLGLRAFYLGELVDAPEFSTPVIDPGFHDYWARALVSGDWTPPEGSADPLIRSTPFVRPPGYPYFLAAIYKVAGLSYLAPRIVQMGLGLLNCVLAFLLARKWFGSAVALILAALMAFYWIFIYFEGEFQEPVLLIFLLLSFVYVLSFWIQRPAFRFALAAGVLLGLAALVKPNPLLFLPIALAWMWWIARRRSAGRRAYLASLGLILGTAIPIAPVTIRNYVVAGDFALISSNLGINLFIGNNENADGLVLWDIPGFGRFRTCYQYPAIVEHVGRELGRPVKYSEVSSYYTRQALDFVRQNPLALTKLTIRKAFLFWGPDEISHNREINCERRNSTVLANIPGNFPLLLSLCLLGLICLGFDLRTQLRTAPVPSSAPANRLEISILVVSFILVFFVSYLPFVNAALYRAPLIPFLLLFAAYAVYRLGQSARAREMRSIAFLLLGGVCLYVLAAWPFVEYNPPGPAVWHYQRGKVYMKKGDLDRAVEEAQEALRLAPKSVEALDVMARALTRQGRLPEALEHEVAALRIAGPDSQRHGRIGTALCKIGRIDEGITHLQEALRLDPGSAETHANLAIALKLQGKRTEAVDALREAVRLQPENARHRERLGVALCEAGRIDEGIKCFEESQRLDPGFADAHASMAVAMRMQGKIPEAVQEAREALRLEPQNPERHTLLADMLLAQGSTEEAIQHYREALRINPRHPAAQRGLQRAMSGQTRGTPD